VLFADLRDLRGSDRRFETRSEFKLLVVFGSAGLQACRQIAGSPEALRYRNGFFLASPAARALG
jgi:hypothetical protein